MPPIRHGACHWAAWLKCFRHIDLSEAASTLAGAKWSFLGRDCSESNRWWGGREQATLEGTQWLPVRHLRSLRQMRFAARESRGRAQVRETSGYRCSVSLRRDY